MPNTVDQEDLIVNTISGAVLPPNFFPTQGPLLIIAGQPRTAQTLGSFPHYGWAGKGEPGVKGPPSEGYANTAHNREPLEAKVPGENI